MRQKKDRVTTDDILDSLIRQAELRQKLGETVPLDLMRLQGEKSSAGFRG